MGRLDRKPLAGAPTNDWFRKAEAGEPDALFNLGLMYSTGDGVDLDYISASRRTSG
jgi:TPR repeat protein